LSLSSSNNPFNPPSILKALNNTYLLLKIKKI
jgi:hypothetical protein